jgi:cyclic pyranopterin phosphate synthase
LARQRSIHAKPLVFRRAVALGGLRLGKKSLSAIRRGRVEKGDPLRAGELAGLMAMKRTPELIPHCHPIPLTGGRVDLRVVRGGVGAECEAEAVYRTGVEMEALVGVTVALLTVWDMVKYLEKDARGGYPTARLGPIRVVTKEKGTEREAAT